MRRLLATLVLVALTLPAGWVTPSAEASEGPTRDPRNWPTVTRLVADRYELAGRIVTLRVHAKRSDYYNCGYRHARGQLMAFTLMGGPLETITGYMPKDLGRVLDRVLTQDPWAPITVQVRYDPERVDDACPDQVEVVKWARGWQYPPGSLTPGRPDATMQPTREAIEDADQRDLWRGLTGRKVRRRWGAKDNPPTEEELLGTLVELTAGARLTTAFHCGFRGSARTHYAIRLHDTAGHFIHAYVPRSRESAALVDVLALHRDVLLEVQGRVVKQIPSNYCQPQLEVTGWSFPDAR